MKVKVTAYLDSLLKKLEKKNLTQINHFTVYYRNVIVDLFYHELFTFIIASLL